ncbi:hypothetical protein, partial [Sinomicrobium soli]|uniref:hypothetical protein n=1 Tax=Sinomicrobium sp. N-1-3-6 TaxID=2219864 RepID=UPI000DCF2169
MMKKTKQLALLAGVLLFTVFSCERSLNDEFPEAGVQQQDEMKAVTKAARQHYIKSLKKEVESGFST